MNYKPSRDIPQFARESKTLSPSKIADHILNRRNVERTAESITMWFKDNAHVYEELKREIVQNLPREREKIDVSIFETCNFSQLPTIRTWILEMKSRELSDRYIPEQVGIVRNVCMGRFRKHGIDLVLEQKWAFKHPDRLTLDDAIELIPMLRERGIDTCHYKRGIKDFLISKGVIVGKKIAVGKSRSYGRLARLYVERSILNQMLSWIARNDFEAYVADDFMFKTGTRLSATLNALIENISCEGRTIFVYDKGRRSLYQHGKEWQKQIPSRLWTDIQQIIGKRKSGRIFQHLKVAYLGKLNRQALRMFVPHLEPKISMPNHFWRHMFFQHMLRATDWNYAVCAELGGSTISSLQESYGKPPQAIVREWGLKYMPTLETSEEDTLIYLAEQPSRG
jgi:hypothetical protein